MSEGATGNNHVFVMSLEETHNCKLGNVVNHDFSQSGSVSVYNGLDTWRLRMISGRVGGWTVCLCKYGP